MQFGIFTIPEPYNEPVKNYAPGSPEREELIAKCNEMKSQEIEIPIMIGDQEIKTGNLGECRIPHDHQHLLGKYHKAGEKEIELAIETALKAKEKWANLSFQHRAAIFLRAAELLATKYRATANAACMLTQSKTCHQAEIDAACELIDFFRFNVKYAEEMYAQQPMSSKGVWNFVEYRPLEGFIFAITPFNFLSIAGNLPTAPALMGNVVLWKPASSSVYSAYYIMKLLKEAGLPDGVINMVPGSGAQVGDPVMNNPHLAGVHFTGSTEVFRNMWKTVGNNIEKYHSYPRIVGETGGKDFMFIHKTAPVQEVVTAMVRGAYEYQGQKCSAASRAYVPESMWTELREKLEAEIKTIKMGDVLDFSNFVAAVIDKNAYKSIVEYIDYAKQSDDAEIIIGGNYDDSKGYFIRPTVILAKKPDFKTMEEEIFGPVLTIYVYPDNEFEKTLDICNNTSIYALTGGIFANDPYAIQLAYEKLRDASGNFYINDKITGAVVGQQPFGGARASGTNDKAGSAQNLSRWVSVRTVKQCFTPPTSYKYPFMD